MALSKTWLKTTVVLKATQKENRLILNISIILQGVLKCVYLWLDAGVEPLGSEWSSDALLSFQKALRDVQLSARVLSVSEQGYNVKLEIRGQDVATALISVQLAKAPGAVLEEKHATPDSKAEHREKIKEHEELKDHGLIQVQASSLTGASSRETPTEGATLLSEGQLECRSREDEIQHFDD